MYNTHIIDDKINTYNVLTILHLKYVTVYNDIIME